MSCHEINFDGLVGPTHNYAGLAFGNLASSRNRSEQSNPRAAALEGLEKMKMLSDLGVMQAVIPPLLRPDIQTLRQLGFSGPLQQVLHAAWTRAPELFAACCSASSMWTANAATVAPASDTLSGKLILTPANLVTNFHRAIEASATTQLLRAIFANGDRFLVNDPLPAFAGLADEGAANHMRLGGLDQPGVHVLVFGTRDHLQSPTQRFPARQTLSASEAVVRLNQVPDAQVLYVQQHPAAIDAGAFHNDVVAVSHQQHLFCHELAFTEQSVVLPLLRDRCRDSPLKILEVKATEIPLSDAIQSYLFNSQLVTTRDGTICMILPVECEDSALVKHYVQDMVVNTGFVDRVVYVNVRQSMRNGGGPACLRLRVAMTDADIACLQERALLTPERYQQLRQIIASQYPDQLRLEQLQDAALVRQLQQTLRQIYQCLDIEFPFADVDAEH